MQKQALYRQIRPRTFGEIIGQTPIIRALKTQIAQGRTSHAYLFSGTRGTGKTSAARILARAINCQAPADGEPCNTCAICTSILREQCMDVAEIDAASNNGVDSIRELNNEVKYMPTMGRAKVYIVDEVHMLSTSAFNALLKTLEEPPAHIVFILATTEPAKIPATIISRCQRYDFRRISMEDAAAAMARFLESINAAFEPDALEYIAYHADGAMRDCLSILDRCMGLGADVISLELVRGALLAVDEASLFGLADALCAKNAADVLRILEAAMDDGRDARQFCEDIIKHLRDVLVAKLMGGAGYSADHKSKLLAQGDKFSVENLVYLAEGFSETLRQIKQGHNARVIFEMNTLRLCIGPVAQPSVQPVAPTSAPSAPAPTSTPPPVPAPAPAPTPPPAPVQSTPTPAPTPLPPTETAAQRVVRQWSEICADMQGPLSAAKRCSARVSGAGVQISSENGSALERLAKMQDQLCAAIQQYIGQACPTIVFDGISAYNADASVGVPPPAKADTQWDNFGAQAFDEADWNSLINQQNK